MVKGFYKFLKFKNKTNNNYAHNKRQSRKQEHSSTPTCYECGKTGHIKPDCPVPKMKQKLEGKTKAKKHMKKKKLILTVEDNDSSTSTESDESTEEENNVSDGWNRIL